MSLIDSVGERGPQGVQGPQGPQGAQGPTGAAGSPAALTGCVLLMAGLTPTATGGDDLEFVVPYDVDGTTSKTYAIKRVTLRLKTASTSGSATIQIEKSTAAGAFSGTNQLAASLSAASGVHQASTTSMAGGQGTVASGDKLRVNVSALGTGTAGWSVSVELQRTN